MANYNYFPQTYSPTTTPYGYSATASLGQTYAPPQAGAITWVQGEAGARSINVPAGQTSLLMDSEQNIFYIKTSDVSGIPLPLRKFKYEELGADEVVSDPPQNTYITKEELDKRLEEFARQFTEKPEVKEDNNNGKFDF